MVTHNSILLRIKELKNASPFCVIIYKSYEVLKMARFLVHPAVENVILSVDDLNSMGLRVRAYGGDRLRRDRLVGEKFVAFSSLDLDDLEEQGQGQVQGRGQSLEKLIELEPRSNIEVSVSTC